MPPLDDDEELRSAGPSRRTVAPFSVSISTGWERNVPDSDRPIVSRTPSSPQAIEVLDWRGGCCAGTSPRERSRASIAALMRPQFPRPIVGPCAVAGAEHREPEDALLAELVRARASPAMLAVAHDDDPVAHRDHLGQLGGDQEHARRRRRRARRSGGRSRTSRRRRRLASARRGPRPPAAASARATCSARPSAGCRRSGSAPQAPAAAGGCRSGATASCRKAAVSSAMRTTPKPRGRSSDASPTFSRIECARIRPSRLRSSGITTMPGHGRRRAACWRRTGRPLREDGAGPRRAGCHRARSRDGSWPEPTRPATPSTSPARSSKLTGLHVRAKLEARAPPERPGRARGLRGGRVADVRPDHQPDQLVGRELRQRRVSITTLPSFSTVARSARRKISARRWEM